MNDIEVIREALSGRKRTIDREGGWEYDTPPFMLPALAALDRLAAHMQAQDARIRTLDELEKNLGEVEADAAFLDDYLREQGELIQRVKGWQARAEKAERDSDEFQRLRDETADERDHAESRALKAERALAEIANLSSQDVQFAAVGGVAGEMRKIARAALRLSGKAALRDVVARGEAAAGLPTDLIRVLRDPTITIQRDHEIRLADGRTLFEHLEEWRKAPSNTASAEPPDGVSDA